jgi:hypothetical protein
MSKKKQKDAIHAANNWQKAQLKAAALVQEIDNAEATIEAFRNELSDDVYAEVQQKMSARRDEVSEFLLKARDYYVSEINRIGEVYFTEIDKVILEKLEE